MINILLLSVESVSTEAEGGLFDFNATLPLMVLQFLVLMILLNLIFYKPVAKILDERSEYIRNSLTTASASLNQADKLTIQYEEELSSARKKAQEIIRASQKESQDIVLKQVKDAQQEAELLINEASQQLVIQKEKAIKTLEDQVETLSDQIEAKILNNQSLA
uniref:ATP synthase CFO B' chain subunit II n=1 Tax=Palmaria palmata TaxID=2822 RepID=A0A1C9CH40_PALPL|nr:ATP synthase CFO B' chain subunit II [Palmaria palmata]AOM67677.1 ATP synthase CFO B' chain subunit II [Palmaria palmata]